MPKRNIYFADDLTAGMNKHRATNWSEVCQEAVRAKLEELDEEQKILEQITRIWTEHNALMM
jgi:hypothetical protein